jgi:hypothetical protein
MPQVTIYLPDDVAARLRREAKKAGRSLSAYIANLATRKPERNGWPTGFSKLYGSWRGNFPEIEDSPPEEREPLR